MGGVILREACGRTVDRPRAPTKPKPNHLTREREAARLQLHFFANFARNGLGEEWAGTTKFTKHTKGCRSGSDLGRVRRTGAVSILLKPRLALARP